MRVNKFKLELALARACKNARQLRPEVPQQTMYNCLHGKEVKPETLGRLAKALGVDPLEIIESEEK